MNGVLTGAPVMLDREEYYPSKGGSRTLGNHKKTKHPDFCEMCGNAIPGGTYYILNENNEMPKVYVCPPCSGVED